MPTWKPFGLRLIVRRYQYPKMSKYIYLGLSQDESGTLWDLVRWNDEVEEYLGVPLSENTILETPSDVAVPFMDNLFIIPASAVVALHQWGEDDPRNGGTNDSE